MKRTIRATQYGQLGLGQNLSEVFQMPPANASQPNDESVHRLPHLLKVCVCSKCGSLKRVVAVVTNRVECLHENRRLSRYVARQSFLLRSTPTETTRTRPDALRIFSHSSFVESRQHDGATLISPDSHEFYVWLDRVDSLWFTPKALRLTAQGWPQSRPTLGEVRRHSSTPKGLRHHAQSDATPSG